MQSVKDLSIDQLRSLIAEVVEEKFRELLGDPDEGLTLRPEVRERLLKSLNLPQDSRQTTPATDVAAQLGLEW
ncbi:MAG TPA: hypothetical protein VM182_14330 [Terriglobia bacterium]|nr:hypothetical protein [Terriglobia bacterium]